MKKSRRWLTAWKPDTDDSFRLHVAIELHVPGATHLPHAAFADLGSDRIRAESGADF